MKKDYSEYFKGPSLKDARKRGKTDVRRLDNVFEIPPDMVGIGKGRSYFIQTYGCQANERDTEVLSGILETMGYRKADDVKDAQVVLLNTCAIRENAEEKVFGKIGYLKNVKREHPDIIFGVCGCMAQEEVVVEKIRKKMKQVDLIFGTHNIHRLPQLLKQAMLEKETVIEVWSKEGDVIENLPSTRAKDKKAWVNIMYGCNKFCTYCIVPYTRGKERSRLMEDVLKEVQELKDKGYLEINLLGQNVNSYGKDLDTDYNFATLLEEVAKIGIPRVRFMTSHPWDFSEDMIQVIAKYDNIMPFIHLPVQSGNSDVLKIMGRVYTREQYLKLFDRIREVMPKCAITTDIIVGFPNETEEQFEDTLSLYDHCQYDLAYTFVYSAREGTPAAKMIDNVDIKTKEARLQRLNEKVNYYAGIANKKYIDTVQKVLVDGPSKKNPDILSGYTETNKLVNFKGNPEHIGTIVPVKITEAKTWTLEGEEVVNEG
ncbi:MiaB family RNA modification protein [Kandleria vitulina DSM 20405]|jgi:tRNA-2-methylthio-N6-dimethylallyladenosine synthase|uniref:tRNA-2-methylthio-N(6)-dimethylallyladenosine synthase n=1 Tax=Kandleria vitulina DSM 20405 TaxID=1410657 RepID=A0A0R2HE92_9FIRM|nr:tRNA (N6-isopentenyl adenosine(37)-C2)-methylthiotransferase MiaB [Kandleria vitulina]KRN50795.1 MiaB family RNA modification protein [Kandleria vitulina DSM 20405]SDL76905.1 tRNA-2-methylthio-N6-dimethylallyladenosine synthase [Kandleria vitulina]SEI71517.1 tRNA-2-methylthio-N6-dimethylallyladenosine synthase [Kandleria vitulina]